MATKVAVANEAVARNERLHSATSTLLRPQPKADSATPTHLHNISNLDVAPRSLCKQPAVVERVGGFGVSSRIITVPLVILARRHQAIKEQDKRQWEHRGWDAGRDGDLRDALQHADDKEVRVRKPRELLEQEHWDEV